MDIIDVTREISLITYRVFPKSPLPDTPFSLGSPGGGSAFAFRNSRREPALDESPSRRKISVALRQSPYRMQVLTQHNPCVDAEWIQCANARNRSTQGSDFLHQKVAAPIGQGKGEEIRPAFNTVSPVIWHLPAASFYQRHYDTERVGCGRAPHPTPLAEPAVPQDEGKAKKQPFPGPL
jgi:hypothetical protein